GNDLTTWLRDWAAALYTDDAVVGVSSEYTHPSWNYRSLYAALNASYQLGVRSLVNNTTLTLSYVAGGGATHARFAILPSSSANIVFRTSGGGAPSSTVNLTLMRVR
ncbi:MAG: hypothetical protein ACK41E_01235, partial [Deinococcales bacterium]